MTKKTLLKKLIAHYTKAATKMTEDDWRALIRGGEPMDSGICDLANKVFDQQIHSEDWVQYWMGFNATGSEHWTWIRLMGYCESLAELLANIETRVEIMCHELYSGV